MNVKKLTQTVSYILQKYDGRRLNYTKLIKMLYFADRKALLSYGWTITGDDFVSMRCGMVLSITLNLIHGELFDSAEQKLWDACFSVVDRYDIVQIKDDITKSELCDAETDILDEIDSKYHELNFSKMIDEHHIKEVCPEWVKTFSSIPVSRSEILEKHGFSDEEIKQPRS